MKLKIKEYEPHIKLWDSSCLIIGTRYVTCVCNQVKSHQNEKQKQIIPHYVNIFQIQ